MVIYRPHRGGFAEAMALAKEFATIEEMKEHIVQEHTDEEIGLAFGIDDIVFGEEMANDPRNGWRDTRYVCVKRYFNEVYQIPQCIGMCATDYDRKCCGSCENLKFLEFPYPHFFCEENEGCPCQCDEVPSFDFFCEKYKHKDD